MNKLNNKGFAITGILYTLFILFLLILVSVLEGLSSKKNISINMLSSFENDYKGTKLNATDTTKAINNKLAPVDGKYVFSCKNQQNIDGSLICSTYLKKGTSFVNLKDITFTPKDCNEYNLEMTLEEIYSFEKE